MTTTINRPGDPCWADVAVSDMQGAKAFYEKLLGWTFGETQEDMGGYTQAYKNGKAVAGLYHLMPDMTTSVWSIYFATDDITKCEQTIKDSGGAIIAPPMAVQELGSMMVATDPTGGVFGVWQAGTFGGAELFNDSGSLTWEDLRSVDPAASRAFFTSLFGFRHDDLPMESPFDYKTFAHPDADRPLGGMGDMMGAPAGLPSHWLAYFRVDDTPASVEVITAAGGAVLSPPMETPFGRQSVVTDPYGATFCIIDTYGVQ